MSSVSHCKRLANKYKATTLLVTPKQRFSIEQQLSDGKKVIQIYRSYKLTSVSLVELIECIPHIRIVNTYNIIQYNRI